MNKVVSKKKMGFLGHTFHITLSVFSMGLWVPVYMSRLRARKTVTYYPEV